MIVDFIPVLENGVSIRLPKVADVLRVFLILRASQKTKGVTSGGVALRTAFAVSGDGGRAVRPLAGVDPG